MEIRTCLKITRNGDLSRPAPQFLGYAENQEAADMLLETHPDLQPPGGAEICTQEVRVLLDDDEIVRELGTPSGLYTVENLRPLLCERAFSKLTKAEKNALISAGVLKPLEK